MYVIDAALEYFVSIITAGAYLAKLTSTLGIPDSLTGILSSFVSLGSAMSLFSVLVTRKKPIKRKTLLLQLICQAFFVLLFSTPLFGLKNDIATLIFCIFFLGGYALYNIIFTVKADWYLGLVDKSFRGRFTALAQNTALGTGMLFSLCMGYVIDYFDAKDNTSGFLVTATIVLAVIGILRVVTVIFSREKEYTTEEVKESNFKEQCSSLLKNKQFIIVNVYFILNALVRHSATPFFGTYQIKELGFTMLYVSIIGIVHSVSRIIGTFIFGKIGDAKGLNTVLYATCIMNSLAMFLAIFIVPENGKWLYLVFDIIYAASIGSLSICQVNSLLEVAKPNERSAAIAIKYSVSGLVGFLTALVFSPLVDKIQKSGTQLFGIEGYAQQFMSAIAFALSLVLFAFTAIFIAKRKPKEK